MLAYVWDHRCNRCKCLQAVDMARVEGAIVARCAVCGQVHTRMAPEDLVEDLDAWIDAGSLPDQSTAWPARCAWAAKLIRPTPRAAAVATEGEDDR